MNRIEAFDYLNRFNSSYDKRFLNDDAGVIFMNNFAYYVNNGTRCRIRVSDNVPLSTPLFVPFKEGVNCCYDIKDEIISTNILCRENSRSSFIINIKNIMDKLNSAYDSDAKLKKTRLKATVLDNKIRVECELFKKSTSIKSISNEFDIEKIYCKQKLYMGSNITVSTLDFYKMLFIIQEDKSTVRFELNSDINEHRVFLRVKLKDKDKLDSIWVIS